MATGALADLHGVLGFAITAWALGVGAHTIYKLLRALVKGEAAWSWKARGWLLLVGSLFFALCLWWLWPHEDPIGKMGPFTPFRRARVFCLMIVGGVFCLCSLCDSLASAWRKIAHKNAPDEGDG